MYYPNTGGSGLIKNLKAQIDAIGKELSDTPGGDLPTTQEETSREETELVESTAAGKEAGNDTVYEVTTPAQPESPKTERVVTPIFR